ncbi:uncharacterized protein C1orf131 homolog [Eleutherodactylus coqui]|uniref:uncharacterized protein C1orf131 homolog n=1 Tax=Eleutherodactylus coqui TaxID=57060 RepID=UPI0034620B3C
MTAREQLDAVLGNLYDFGDDFVTREEQVPVRGQSKEPSEDKESYKVNGRVEDQQAVVCSKRGKKTVSVFFDSIKDELSSQAKTPVMSATSVPQPSAVEVVSFLSHKGKKRSQDQHLRGMYIEKTIESGEDRREFNFEKVRLEVHKFGITGYKKETQRKLEVERAIMLGAKPPKREYVNYKLYQANKKEKEQKQKENGLETERKKQKQERKDRRSRKTKGSRTAPSGQLGRFRNGALFLSGKDIEKIKKSRVTK